MSTNNLNVKDQQTSSPSEHIEQARTSFRGVGEDSLERALHDLSESTEQPTGERSFSSEDTLDTLCDYFSRYVPAGSGGAAADRMFLSILVRHFGAKLDLEEQFMKFYAWILDQPADQKINYRSRFRNWLKRAITDKHSSN